MRGGRGICHFVRNSMLELLIYFIRRKNWICFFSIYSESWLNVQYISGPIFPRVGNLFLWENLCNNACLKIDTATLDRDVCFRYMRGSRKLLSNPPTLSDPHMHEFFPCVWLVWSTFDSQGTLFTDIYLSWKG